MPQTGPGGVPLALRLSEGLGSAFCQSDLTARRSGIGLLAATFGTTVRACRTLRVCNFIGPYRQTPRLPTVAPRVAALGLMLRRRMAGARFEFRLWRLRLNAAMPKRSEDTRLNSSHG